MFAIAKKHLHEGRIDAAEQTASEFLAQNPGDPETLHLLGLIRWQRGDRTGAIAYIERAIALPNANAVWHSNLAEMCRVEGRLDEALEHGKRGVELNPDHADAHYNLGLVYNERGDTEEAIACERRAIALTPDHASAHFELGEALLQMGNFCEGWDEYEWRFKIPGVPPLVPLPKASERAWNGEPLDDKTLLVIGDQGYGDVFQFLRYVPRAAAHCRELIIACGEDIMPFIRRMMEKAPQEVRLFTHWQDAPAFDWYMALSSLPRLFGTELQTIPAETPYLRADRNRIDHWRQRLRILTPASYRRIGLVWSGRTGPRDAPNRATTLQELSALATLPDVVLVSLQKNDAGAQTGSYYGAAPFINLAPEIKDFEDTAAIIENLDLVVTIDTSVAHLTGALGRPAAILLKFAADWRWLCHRNDSPWYPSVRLYRQSRPGDWQSAIANLVQDLRDKPSILNQGYVS